MIDFPLIIVRADEAQDAAALIIQELKERGLYQSNLMYRGCAVDNEGLAKFQKYGTDCNPEDVQGSIERALEEYDDIITRMDEQEFEEHRRKKVVVPQLAQLVSNPDVLWALPRAGLTICIQEYTYGGLDKPISLISVYCAEYLIRFSTMDRYEGMEANKIPPRFLMDEELASYRFKEGTTAQDAIVALFRLEEVLEEASEGEE